MAMRVAALYDVHGDTRAWNPWPRETLERVQSLGDRARFVRGNWERYLLEGQDEWTAQHVPADVVRDRPRTVTLDGVVYCHATPLRSDWSAFTALQLAIDRVVNPGSVGLPTVSAAAWWAVVEDGDVELRATPYPDAIRRSGMPEAEELAGELLQPRTVAQLLERLG